MEGTVFTDSSGTTIRYDGGPAAITVTVPRVGQRIVLGWSGKATFSAGLRFFRDADGPVGLIQTMDAGVESIPVADLADVPTEPAFVRLEAIGNASTLVVCLNLDIESDAYDNVTVDFDRARFRDLRSRLTDAILGTETCRGSYESGQVERALDALPGDLRQILRLRQGPWS